MVKCVGVDRVQSNRLAIVSGRFFMLAFRGEASAAIVEGRGTMLIQLNRHRVIINRLIVLASFEVNHAATAVSIVRSRIVANRLGKIGHGLGKSS